MRHFKDSTTQKKREREREKDQERKDATDSD